MRSLSWREVERECAPVVGVELALLSLACVLAVDDERLVLEHRACLHLHLIASAVVVKCKLRSNEFAADVVVGHAGGHAQNGLIYGLLIGHGYGRSVGQVL